MPLMNTDRGWGLVARLLHWLSAVMILGLLAVGFYMVEVLGASDSSDAMMLRYDLTQDHKSFGFVAFCLAVLRLIWRAANPTPPPPPGQPWLEEMAARGAHLALYVLIFAMPLSGWLMATSSPLNDDGAWPMQIRNTVFGLFALPDPYPTGDEALSKLFGLIHFWCGLALATLIGIHVLAALKHQFINRDGLLRRMIRGG